MSMCEYGTCVVWLDKCRVFQERCDRRDNEHVLRLQVHCGVDRYLNCIICFDFFVLKIHKSGFILNQFYNRESQAIYMIGQWMASSIIDMRPCYFISSHIINASIMK